MPSEHRDVYLQLECSQCERRLQETADSVLIVYFQDGKMRWLRDNLSDLELVGAVTLLQSLLLKEIQQESAEE